MRSRNKLLSFLLVFSLLLHPAVKANASDRAPNTKSEYLQHSVSAILPLLYRELNYDNSFSLGNCIPTYVIHDNQVDSTSYELYPIFYAEKIVGFVYLFQNEKGSFSITAGCREAEEFSNSCLRIQKTAFALLCTSDGWIAINNEGEMVQFWDEEHDTLGSINSVDLNKEIHYSKTEPQIPLTYMRVDLSQTINASSLQYMSLSIPFVSNDSTSCCSGGICWAASIAMIVNYYRGSSYSARNVHDASGIHSYGSTASSFISALRMMGAFAYGPYYSFTYNTIQNIVQGGHPAFMRIQSGSSGHAIVPCEYYYNPGVSSIKYFGFQDCNSGFRVQSFPTSGSLTISTSTGTYTFDYYLGTSW